MANVLTTLLEAHRLRRVRKAAAEWLDELERVEPDWDATHVLWQFIGVWLAHDAAHCRIFLPAFRRWARARPRKPCQRQWSP